MYEVCFSNRTTSISVLVNRFISEEEFSYEAIRLWYINTAIEQFRAEFGVDIRDKFDFDDVRIWYQGEID